MSEASINPTPAVFAGGHSLKPARASNFWIMNTFDEEPIHLRLTCTCDGSHNGAPAAYINALPICFFLRDYFP